MRIQLADRQVLGHPLHEPERNLLIERVQLPGQAARHHIELERVDELVGEHVLEVGVRAREGQDDAFLRELGDAARALRDEPGQSVGLLELRMGRVEDDGLPILELVAEDTAEARVRTLGHPRGVQRRCPLAGIVVDVEMRAANDLEVEDLVLDLVATELGAGGRGRQCGLEAGQGEDGHQRMDQGGSASVHESPSSSTSVGASPQSRSSW